MQGEHSRDPEGAKQRTLHLCENTNTKNSLPDQDFLQGQKWAKRKKI